MVYKQGHLEYSKLNTLKVYVFAIFFYSSVKNSSKNKKGALIKTGHPFL